MYTVPRALSFPRERQDHATYECTATLARDLVMDETRVRNLTSNRQAWSHWIRHENGSIGGNITSRPWNAVVLEKRMCNKDSAIKTPVKLSWDGLLQQGA